MTSMIKKGHFAMARRGTLNDESGGWGRAAPEKRIWRLRCIAAMPRFARPPGHRRPVARVFSGRIERGQLLPQPPIFGVILLRSVFRCRAIRGRHFGMLLLLVAALLLPARLAMAQAPLLAPATPRPGAAPPSERPPAVNERVLAPSPDHEEPEILRSLPRPPSQPVSLFQQAAPPGPPAPDFEHPYFQKDPLLDPLDWPQPGWFGDAEIGILHPYVNYPTIEFVTTATGTQSVQLGTAHLNWVAAPRVEIGYRLPSGFGEFLVSDRYFNARGSDTTATANGPAARQSEFMLNYTDIDYASRELTPYTGWSLRFHVGLRVAETYLGTRVDQSVAQAAAGNGVFAGRQTNRDRGVGPHFGVQADRRFARSGLTWVSQIDVATVFTHVRQENFLAATTPGGIETGDAITTFTQNMPVLSVQMGLNWQPPRLPNSRLYVGYLAQFWYLFGTNSNVTPVFLKPVYTSFQYEGIVLQWSLNH